MRTAFLAPTVDTEVNFWPAMIDMITSLLMFFMLIHFVQQNINPESLASKMAQEKQTRFREVFNREFANEIANGEIRVASDVNLLQITFGEGILFPIAEYRLQPRGEAILQRMARVIRELDSSTRTPIYEQIQIEGHTDSTAMQHSSYPHDNWELSTARALAVLRFLMQPASALDARRMSANGYADTRPLGGVRARNRRIEIRFYFSGQEATSTKDASHA